MHRGGGGEEFRLGVHFIEFLGGLRSSLQTVDGVHRGRVTLHQVDDGAVHQSLALKHAPAG